MIENGSAKWFTNRHSSRYDDFNFSLICGMSNFKGAVPLPTNTPIKNIHPQIRNIRHTQPQTLFRLNVRGGRSTVDTLFLVFFIKSLTGTSRLQRNGDPSSAGN